MGEAANGSPPEVSDARQFAALKGAVGSPVTKTIVPGDVRRFLGAIASADGGSLTGIVDVEEGDAVPFTFFCPDPIVAAESMGLSLARPFERNIDGGSEWDVRKVVRVGDVLTLVPRVADVSERRTSDGRRMVTTVVEIVACDGNGSLVGTARGRYLSYEARVTQ